ncbi:formate dehydrogenase subunit gamma [Thioalkalivibrio thiocyanodenitrificans]|uniref:formate dehydrogenase subunit gamma n=1 Tax=Thioalkalivibrio thiocyanodenitrificans TaxID=243063 RepID=UPI00035C1E31|nr:formate dehydrogenase subunit gamma [Thioalkalivibrio thiocyanodenitrificans]
MSDKDKLIERYTAGERRNHWLTAITFILLALSGLALFHPSMYWLTNLFGGGQWTRILHPFIGVLMFVVFLGMMLRFWRHNLINQNDRKWLGQLGDVISNREDRLPPAGRYNAGQKLLFWVMVLCMLILVVTGVIIWQPYFAPIFSIGLVRFALMLHALSAFVLILGIIVHIYAAIWVKGSTRAITRGTVTRPWAKKHHPLWYREVTGEAKE